MTYAMRRYVRTLCGFEWFYTGATIEAPTAADAIAEYAHDLGASRDSIQAVALA